MRPEEYGSRHAEAVEEFNGHENRTDGASVAGSLAGGLTVLRDSLYVRIHDDVRRIYGMDSMYMPISEEETEKRTKNEIEYFQIAESAMMVGKQGYVRANGAWYLDWLARLRVGGAPPDSRPARRFTLYGSQSSEDRRLTFSDVLVRAISDARKAPLVLFRLIPLSVQIATAQAFGDHSTATQQRRDQTLHLPPIVDCHECQGRVLENGERCSGCGNPVWKLDWLTATD